MAGRIVEKLIIFSLIIFLTVSSVYASSFTKPIVVEKSPLEANPQEKLLPEQQLLETTTGLTTQSIANSLISEISISAANTKPGAPTNLATISESMQIVTFGWQAPTSGGAVEYYAFGIGSAPNTANIKWWQSNGLRTSTYFYPLTYGVKEGQTFYISVRATNKVGDSPAISIPVTLTRQKLGDASNNLSVNYASTGFGADGRTVISGWNADEIARLSHFTSRMIPIIKEIYGPPSKNYTVTFVKDMYYSSSAIFLPSSNEIHMNDEWYPQLITHEMIHAFRDDFTISTDSNWQYDDTLTGFEEGFAQAVSYKAMNIYRERYPNDPYVDPNSLWGSSYDFDYDFQNVEELATTDFWSDYNGMALAWHRYEVAAAAMHKIEIENPSFYKQFNEQWYSRINNDPNLRSSRALVVDIIGQIVPKIEGQTASDWINQQYVFDCRIHPGKKIFVRTQHYPNWQDYHINQWLYYYETFSSGSDWAYWDGSKYVYYQLNGSSGNAKIYNFNNNVVWQSNLLIGQYGGFGWDTKNLLSADNSPSFPSNTYAAGLHELQLYKLEVNFGNTTKNVYRIVGDEIVNSRGIWGGIINARGGTIYIDHEGYPTEVGMPVINGTFYGNRNWAGIPNARTGQEDTIPGKIYIRYVDNRGTVFTKQKNIDLGSWNGNHIFLFDFGFNDADKDSNLGARPKPAPGGNIKPEAFAKSVKAKRYLKKDAAKYRRLFLAYKKLYKKTKNKSLKEQYKQKYKEYFRLYRLCVKNIAVANLEFKINNNSPKTDARIIIEKILKSKKGKTKYRIIKKIILKETKTNSWNTYEYHFSAKKRNVYRYQVFATDASGNKQTNTATAYITI